MGFDAVDDLAQRHGLTWSKKLTQKAMTAEGRIHGVRVVLCKPMAFMNVSGESVAPIAKKHGIPLCQVSARCASFCVKLQRDLGTVAPLLSGKLLLDNAVRMAHAQPQKRSERRESCVATEARHLDRLGQLRGSCVKR